VIKDFLVVIMLLILTWTFGTLIGTVILALANNQPLAAVVLGFLTAGALVYWNHYRGRASRT